MGRAVVVYGPLNEWFNNDTTDEQKHKRAAERLTEFMKISKDCTNNPSECMGTISGDSTSFNNGAAFILADGSAIQFRWVTDASYTFTTPRDTIFIIVDIDGPNKGSNTAGKDVFAFKLDSSSSEILPLSAGYSGSFINLMASDCFWGESHKHLACTDWILMYDNMDYLKVDNDKKCPDGKTILDGVSNTTCK